MNGLALCAGVGGLELGIGLAEPGYRTVCYVEREAYAAATLVARMADGCLAPAPVWDDLATFDGRPWRGKVQVVTAGFPCQPFSAAGKRQGIRDERWLWPLIERILREVQPQVVFLENVPQIRNQALAIVLGSLAALGLDAEWDVFSAAASGASHRRRRVFMLGSNSSRRGFPRSRLPAGSRRQRKGTLAALRTGSSGYVAPSPNWPPCPEIRGMDARPPARVDRLRACGNGVVPQVAARAWQVLKERLLTR